MTLGPLLISSNDWYMNIWNRNDQKPRMGQRMIIYSWRWKRIHTELFFFLLHQGISHFGGVVVESRYEKGTRVIKKKNVNVHFSTAPLQIYAMAKYILHLQNLEILEISFLGKKKAIFWLYDYEWFNLHATYIYLYTYIHIMWVCSVFSPLRWEREDMKFCKYRKTTKFGWTTFVFSRNTILPVLSKVCTCLEKDVDCSYCHRMG